MTAGVLALVLPSGTGAREPSSWGHLRSAALRQAVALAVVSRVRSPSLGSRLTTARAALNGGSSCSGRAVRDRGR